MTDFKNSKDNKMNSRLKLPGLAGLIALAAST